MTITPTTEWAEAEHWFRDQDCHMASDGMTFTCSHPHSGLTVTCDSARAAVLELWRLAGREQ